MPLCSACRQPIVWIKTKAGKNMPCDAAVVRYYDSPKGSKRVVTSDGDVISCEYEGSGDYKLGYMPHWATCKNVGRIRRK